MSDVNEKLEVAFCEWWRSMNLALIPLESTRSTFKAGWDAGVEHRPPIRVELATDASGESCEIIDKHVGLDWEPLASDVLIKVNGYPVGCAERGNKLTIEKFDYSVVKFQVTLTSHDGSMPEGFSGPFSIKTRLVFCPMCHAGTQVSYRAFRGGCSGIHCLGCGTGLKL